MATEYKLSYTGAQIDEKLGKVDELSEAIIDCDTNISILNDKVIGLTQLEAPKVVKSGR